VTIEFNGARNNPGNLPVLAADLVQRRPAVIVATGPPHSVLAAKAATSTVPIVFLTHVDPVKYGLVASFTRPGGNVTGMSLLGTELAGKRLSLLLQLASQATTVGYLAAHASAQIFEDQKSRMLDAAKGLAREVVIWQAGVVR
jgi:putative ABC transport system substrate-binding protein